MINDDNSECCIDSPVNLVYDGYAFGGNSDLQKSFNTLKDALKFFNENDIYKIMHNSNSSTDYYFRKSEASFGSNVSEATNFNLYTKEKECSISNDKCKKLCPPIDNKCKVYL